MRENRAKHKLERGETVVCLSGNNSTDMIDQLGPLGFDAIWLEGEHGPVDFGDIPDLTRGLRPVGHDIGGAGQPEQ